MTDKFLDVILSIDRNYILDRTYRKARLCLLDYIACALAGAKVYAGKESIYLEATCPENGICTVLGHRHDCTMHTAAMINGISAHAVELDDGHRIGMMHPGAPVISALLAVAENENMTSIDFFNGMIIGYEAAIRLACAIQPGCKLKGFHATGICGAVGGALAIGSALGFSRSQMKSALAAAASSASGLLEMIDGNTELKPFNAGNAAMSAVSAALIGKAGFRTPADPIGGKRGFLRVFGDEIRKEYLETPCQGKYLIDSIYNKPYASCRHTHPEIEAAFRIREQEGFDIHDIISIHVDTYRLAVNGHDHTAINGVNSSKMSIPYSLAVALHTGKAGLDEFSPDFLNNQEILDTTAKVKVYDKDEYTALSPAKRVAEVQVHTTGNVFSALVEYPKGEPENPLSSDEFDKKFKGLMEFAGYSEEKAEECRELVMKSDFRIKELTSIL